MGVLNCLNVLPTLFCRCCSPQGWVKTGISQDKTIQDRDKILKLKTRHLQDSHIAVKTIQDFQVIKTFGSRQVKNFNFLKFTRQDRSRQDSCQEKFKNS